MWGRTLPRQPNFTSEVVTGIVAAPQKEQMSVFYVLCAAGGLRFGEALGIDIRNISPDCSMIKIYQKAEGPGTYLPEE
jgi:hypothetical protein